MDKRETFDNIDQLHSIVSMLYEQKQKVSLLIDDEGLERREGIITRISENLNIDKTSISIDNSNSIFLNQIVAINGIFRSDYSEC